MPIRSRHFKRDMQIAGLEIVQNLPRCTVKRPGVIVKYSSFEDVERKTNVTLDWIDLGSEIFVFPAGHHN